MNPEQPQPPQEPAVSPVDANPETAGTSSASAVPAPEVNPPQEPIQSTGMNLDHMPGSKSKSGLKLIIIAVVLVTVAGSAFGAVQVFGSPSWLRPYIPGKSQSPVAKTSSTPTPTAKSTCSTAVQSGSSTQAAQAVAKQVVDCTAAKNWSVVFALLSIQVKGGMTESEFVTSAAGDGSQVIVGGALNGSGESKVVGAITYFSQPVTVTVQKANGSTSTMHLNEYLILESGAWKLLSTDTPKP